MTKIELLTLSIGIGVFILSLYLAFVRYRRNVRIICFIDEVWFAWSDDVIKSKVVCIRAINTRERPVTIVTAGLIFEDGESYVSTHGTGPLPKLLNDGEKETVRINLDEVEQAVRSDRLFINGFAEDAEGKMYKGDLPRELVEMSLAKQLNVVQKLFGR